MVRLGFLNSISAAYPPPAYPPPGYPPPGYPPPGYPPSGYPPPGYRPPRSNTPTVAGILLIIAGIDGLINWIAAAVVLSSFPIFGSEFALLCGALGTIFGIFAIIGGIMAIQRKVWALALIGSILGLFTVGFIFEASILSLVALILIAISKDEFYP